MAGIRRNLIGSVYLSGASLGSQLALVPVFLHFWGAQVYGWWLVLFTIPAFFVFSDVGLSNTVGNAVTLALEQGRPAEAEAKLNAAWKFQAVAWAVIFALFVILLVFFPLKTWLGVAELTGFEFIPTTLLLCLYSLVSLQTGVLAAIYRGARRYPSYLMWTAHGRVLETALVVLVLLVDGRYVAVAGAMFMARILLAIVLYIVGRRLLPDVRLEFFAGRWGDLAPLLPSGLAFLSFPVANALINQGTVLVVNQFAGSSAVVLLSVCRQLARVFQQGTSIILTAFQPEMTSAFGTGDRLRMRQLQSSALVLPLLISVPFIIVITTIGGPLILAWTRKDLGVTWMLLLACGLEAVAFGCGAIASLVPWSINQIRELSIIYIVANIAGLLFAGMGLQYFGIIAVPTAFFIVGMAYCLAGLRLGCQIGDFDIGSLFASGWSQVAGRWRANWLGVGSTKI